MDVWRVLTTPKEPDQDKWIPKQPTVADAKTNELIFNESIKMYMKRKEEY